MHWENKMEEITEERSLELMKAKFPKFPAYWETYIKDHGFGHGFTIQVLPFCKYSVDVINTKDEYETKRIFDFVEFLLCDGNDTVQTAMTTAYLEYLMSKDPDEIQFTTFAKYLGKNSIGYCRAWDEFTGVRTKGLWDD
jgi:hypothetical protein